MATWKKVIVSGSVASLAEVSASVGFKGNLIGGVTGNVTGNASTATALASAVNIGGVSFDGSSAINLPGVNASGNQDTSGNAATATLLANSRTIGGVAFNGSADILDGIISSSAQIGVGDGGLTQNNFTNTLKSKLDNIEASADVTDAAGIAALGAGIISSSAQVSSLAGVENSTITLAAGDGLKTGGSFTLNNASDSTITFDFDASDVAGNGIVANGENLDANVDDSSIEISGSGQLKVKASGITNGMLAGSIANGKLANSSISIDGSAISLGGSVTTLQLGTTGTTALAGNTPTISGGQASAITTNTNKVGYTDAAVVTVMDDANVVSGSAANVKTFLGLAASDVSLGNVTNESKATMFTAPTFTGVANGASLVLSGDLTVQGTKTEVQTANLNVEDAFILLNSGSTSGDSGIIFGGSNGTAQAGHALILDNTYNSNDGRLAVKVTDTAANSTADFAAGTSGYYLSGVFEGSAANAATALADHPGNIRIESNEIYIYV
jgi:hypothetical protein